MTITSVFMRLSLSWYFVKAVFHVVIHFSSSSFVDDIILLLVLLVKLLNYPSTHTKGVIIRIAEVCNSSALPISQTVGGGVHVIFVVACLRRTCINFAETSGQRRHEEDMF